MVASPNSFVVWWMSKRRKVGWWLAVKHGGGGFRSVPVVWSEGESSLKRFTLVVCLEVVYEYSVSLVRETKLGAGG